MPLCTSLNTLPTTFFCPDKEIMVRHFYQPENIRYQALKHTSLYHVCSLSHSGSFLDNWLSSFQVTFLYPLWNQIMVSSKPRLWNPLTYMSWSVCLFSSFLSIMCSSSELSQQEVHGLSCVLRRLTTNFSVSRFSCLGAVQLETLIRTLTQLTCLCAQKTVQEEVSLAMEAHSVTCSSLEIHMYVCILWIVWSLSESGKLTTKF